MGDPAGIGPEVIIKALADLSSQDDFDVLVIGNKAVMEQTARQIGIEVKFKVRVEIQIASSDEAKKRSVVLEEEGGVSEASVRRVAERTGVPEADIWGAGLFYTLIHRPGQRVRVCDGLSCRMAGADDLAANEDQRMLAGRTEPEVAVVEQELGPMLLLRDRERLGETEDLEIGDGELVAALVEHVTAHRVTHDTEPDPSNLRHSSFSLE